MSDQTVIDYLRRRWRKGLDLTTIGQAQTALALRPSLAQRLRLFEALRGNRRLWQPIAGYGATPVTVTLTEAEKLVARGLLRGDAPARTAKRLALRPGEMTTARRVLHAVGFLHRGRLLPDPAAFLEGVGFNVHTVRVEGEPAFNVP